MNLTDMIQGVTGFDRWNHAQKIKFFAWFLNSPKARERFMPRDIMACYNELHLEPPSNIGPFLSSMIDRKPKELLKDNRG